MSTPEELKAQFDSFRTTFGSSSGIGMPQQQPIPQITAPQINSIISPSSFMTQIPQIGAPPVAKFNSGGIDFPKIPQISPITTQFPTQMDIPQVQIPNIPSSTKSQEKSDDDDDIFGDGIKPSQPTVPLVSPIFPTANMPATFKTTRPVLSSSTSKLSSIVSIPTINAPTLPSVELPSVLSTINHTAPNMSNTEESAELPDEKIEEFPISSLNSFQGNEDGAIRVSTTISAAVESASEGSLIIVPTGTYNESLTISKRVNLRAEGDVLLLSDGKGDTVSIKAGGITFKGFKIQQNDSQAAGAVNIISGSALFEACSFSSRYMPTIAIKGTSVACFNGCEITSVDSPCINISQNVQAVFTDTKITGSKSTGCIMRGTSKAKFTNCTISNHSKSGIIAADNTEFLVEDSTISDCNYAGIEIASSGFYTVVTRSNIFNCCRAGVLAFVVSTPHINETKISDCGSLIEVSDGAALRSSKNTFTNTKKNDEFENLVMILSFCHSTVDSSEDTFTGIGSAIAVLDKATFTIANAKIDGVDGFGIISSGEGTSVFLDDSVITGATQTGVLVMHDSKINMEGSTIEKCQGAGILVNEGKDVVIKSCEFNEMEKSGIEITHAKGTTKIDKTKVLSNKQTGILVKESKVTISQSTISSNNCNGIDSADSELAIDDTVISENKNDGAAVKGGKIEFDKLTSNKNCGCSLNLLSQSSAKGDRSSFDGNTICVSAKENSEISLSNSTITDAKIALLSQEKSSVTSTKVTFTGNERCVVAGESTSTIDECRFTENGCHIESTADALIVCKGSEFSHSNGIGINVADGEVNIERCVITEEKQAGIAVKGTLTLSGSRIEKCGQCGIYIYGDNVTSTTCIKENTIRNNGTVGIQVMKGKPVIEGNTICGHAGFGIHIEADADPSVCNNTFNDNASVNVNRE